MGIQKVLNMSQIQYETDVNNKYKGSNMDLIFINKHLKQQNQNAFSNILSIKKTKILNSLSTYCRNLINKSN